MNFEDTRNYCVKIDKAQKDLSFEPIKTIDYGIREIKKLLEEHRIRDIDNPRYTNQMYLSMFNSHINPA